MKKILFLLLIANLTLLSAMSKRADKSLIDDWEYNASIPSLTKRLMPMAQRGMKFNSPVMMSAPKPRLYNAKKKIGLAVGGAKDTNNFKANIDKGYLPKLDSLTYEGQFYNHYFDTGIGEQTCKELFCPSYSSAVRKNIFSDEEEYFLSVGLNSGIEEKDFKRKKLNLVVVLDISGSMGSAFDAYYYDKAGNKQKNEDETSKKKMQIANESIVAMLSHLKDDDRVGIALFDNSSYMAKPLRLVRNTNKLAIRDHILALKQRGGTNWSAGYKEGLKLFDEVNLNNKEYENRIVFLTDAMPNSGELGKEKLFGLAKKASLKNIHTTFIGIGVDFNNNLVEYVSKTKGANYFSVHSSKAFSKLLDKEFEYVVNPLVYDLELKLSNSIYTIDGVYGSPDASWATRSIMKINTLFPSSTDGEAIKGGVVLLKLTKNPLIALSSKLNLEVSYKDVNGKEHHNVQEVTFKNRANTMYYENSGIQKAILLSDYVSIMKNWLIDSRAGCNDKVKWTMQKYPDIMKRCMFYPSKHPLYPIVKTWERKSCKLQVSNGYKKLFQVFKKHYVAEQALLNDESLKKELSIINILLKQKKENIKKDDWSFEQ